MTHKMRETRVNGPLPSSNIFPHPPAVSEPALRRAGPAADPPGPALFHQHLVMGYGIVQVNLCLNLSHILYLRSLLSVIKQG